MKIPRLQNEKQNPENKVHEQEKNPRDFKINS